MTMNAKMSPFYTDAKKYYGTMKSTHWFINEVLLYYLMCQTRICLSKVCVGFLKKEINAYQKK